MHKNKILILTLFLIFNCEGDDNLDSSNTNLDRSNTTDSFNKALEKLKKCKDQNKPSISIENGTEKKGLAAKFSTYLNKECYVTYTDNFASSNVPYTFIQVDEKNINIAEKLKKILGKDDIKIQYKEPAVWDMTLVIGKDYKNLIYEIE